MNEAMRTIYFLGVDGGGSRCRARLEAADGRVLGRGLSGPATMRFGVEAALGSIMDAARQTVIEAGLDDAAFANIYAGIGLAGTGQPHARHVLESWRHPFAAASFEGDGYLAYIGAFGGEDGGVVIVGTGSIGLTYRQRTVRIGGYGFPVSDQGSGADLGLKALRHALCTLDGRAKASGFSDAVLARFQHDPSTVAQWTLSASATEYAALAPLVVEHAAAGEPIAIRLMHEAGMHISELVESLLEQGAPRVALCGGLAGAMKPYMHPRTAARLVQPQADAMAGGIILAKRLANRAGDTRHRA
jgi:glucosamine kinase